jgi:hypothetical protein
MSFDPKFSEKLEQLSGFKNSGIAGAESFVLSWNLSTGYAINYWPDDNPPTIAEIEAVVLPLDRTTKSRELKAGWDSHPGVAITLADNSTHLIPIQSQQVTANRLEVLLATLEQRDATVFSTSGMPVVVPLAELAAVAATVGALIQTKLTAYYTAEAAINSAATQAEIDAVDISL